jgi:hypothetical protein
MKTPLGHSGTHQAGWRLLCVRPLPFCRMGRGFNGMHLLTDGVAKYSSRFSESLLPWLLVNVREGL